MKKTFLQHAPIRCNIGILLDLFPTLSKRRLLHVDNTQEIRVFERLSRALVSEIAGSRGCLYFRWNGKSSGKEFGRTEWNVRASRGRDTRRSSPTPPTATVLPRWSMDSDNHLFAGVSYHQHLGPNPFPIPREPRCTFPRRASGAGSQMPIRHLSSN